MLIVDYLRWWYGQGWLNLARYFETRIEHTYHDFSVRILLSTLLSPWRRTIEVGQRSLGDKLKAILGNIVSRGVGFAVRSGALLAAGILMFLEATIGFIAFILWPFVPLGSFVLIVRGIL